MSIQQLGVHQRIWIGFETRLLVWNVPQSLQTALAAVKELGPEMSRARLSLRSRGKSLPVWASVSSSVQWATMILGMNEWTLVQFPRWHFGWCLTVPTQLWHKKQEAGNMKGLGSGNTKGLRTPKRGCELYFSGGLGQPSRLGAPEQLWAEGGRWEWGDSNNSFPPSPPTSLLCVKIPNSQSNPLLFSPFIHLPIFLSSSLLFYPNS